MSQTSTALPATRLHLIRHGETPWSLSRRHTGASEISLTAIGEAQARALKPWLSRIQIDHCFTSPRQRAQRTCDLSGLGKIAQIEPDLAEWDYGQYEGQTTAEIHARGIDWDLFRDGCPAGESPVEISGRADRVIARLRGIGGNIALFSHGQFGCVLAVRWTGQTVDTARHLALDTASLGQLACNPDHPEIPVIALWNAVPRLLLPAVQNDQ